MKFTETPLKGAYVITQTPFQDHRGIFARIFCQNELKEIGLDKSVVQINHSVTLHRGAVRGMHYQKLPHAEIKIVKCIRGGIFDVILDIRRGSDTFLQWYAVELTPENMKMMYIPEGFAHGFQVVEGNSELLYLHTKFYNADYEGAIRYDDPRIGIEWLLEVTEVSERDRHHPLLTSEFSGITV